MLSFGDQILFGERKKNVRMICWRNKKTLFWKQPKYPPERNIQLVDAQRSIAYEELRSLTAARCYKAKCIVELISSLTHLIPKWPPF